jgi:hypothetical protein
MPPLHHRQIGLREAEHGRGFPLRPVGVQACGFECGPGHGVLPQLKYNTSSYILANLLHLCTVDLTRAPLVALLSGRYLPSWVELLVETATKTALIALDYGFRGRQMVRPSPVDNGDLLGKNAIAMSDIEGVFRAESA